MLSRCKPLTICHMTKLFVFFRHLTATSVFFFMHSLAWAANESGNNEEAAELDDIVFVAEESEEVILEHSAAAVDVINLEFDQKLTADLSEVLSREPGISIRRMGALGAQERFSLNGLGDEQIRFFIDGIPLEMSGYKFSISSIPVNLIQRAEIYHGVVPIEFGADALGGAVNLITAKGRDGTGGSISHMAGDFGTNRSTANLKYVDDNSGFFSRLNGFYDYSDNNYEVDVTVPNIFGERLPYKAKRFHNVYEGKGINLVTGYTGQRWADLLQMSLYSSEYYYEIQHNINMSTVYGEPTIERQTHGVNVRYLQQLKDEVSIKLVAGTSDTTSEFIDLAEYSYLWNGKQVITPGARVGEIEGPCDCTYRRNTQFSIMHLQWDVLRQHSVELSVAPTWNEQTARNYYFDDVTLDSTDADQSMFSLVLGAGYTVDLLDDRFQNELFIKRYHQERKNSQRDTTLRIRKKLKSDAERIGWGNDFRYAFYNWFMVKASYEQAVRLPDFREVFGDADGILPNLELNEEYSNNYNFSLKITDLITDYGSWNGEVNFFLRQLEDAIVLLRSNDSAVYQNIARVESEGYDLSAAWSSPEDFINVSVNLTNYDLTNTSTQGRFEKFKNQRIPNTPLTFLNAKLGLKWHGVFYGYDEFHLNWNYRYVDRFELIWDNQGDASLGKPFVAEQNSHSLGVTYSVDFFPYIASVTAEVLNVTDQKLFDYYGVQRPGRAFSMKAVLEF